MLSADILSHSATRPVPAPRSVCAAVPCSALLPTTILSPIPRLLSCCSKHPLTVSLHLARHLLSQHHFPPPPPYSSLFDPSRLRTSRILELGGGTGLLASLLSPLCPEGVYVASDRRENLRLLYRNLELNGRVQPAGAESVSVSPTRRTKSLPKVPTREDEHAVHNTTPSLRSKGTTSHGPPESRYNVQVEEVDWVSIASTRHPQPLRAEERYDLVTAIDCIYNESLCEPLVKTLARYLPVAAGGCALVVVELRSADVVRLSLIRPFTAEMPPP